MTLNTCLLRFTAHHLELISAWRELLEGDRYREQAALPIHRRALGFVSDQEVLTALLGSERFSHIAVRILTTGSDVVHSAGPLSFSLGDRWRWLLKGPPVALHATTGKPWNILIPEFVTGRRSRLTQLAQEVAPYVVAARSYHDQLPHDERTWLQFKTPTGRVLSWIGLGHPALQGLPLTLVASFGPRPRRNSLTQPRLGVCPNNQGNSGAALSFKATQGDGPQYSLHAPFRFGGRQQPLVNAIGQPSNQRRLVALVGTGKLHVDRRIPQELAKTVHIESAMVQIHHEKVTGASAKMGIHAGMVRMIGVGQLLPVKGTCAEEFLVIGVGVVVPTPLGFPMFEHPFHAVQPRVKITPGQDKTVPGKSGIEFRIQHRDGVSPNAWNRSRIGEFRSR